MTKKLGLAALALGITSTSLLVAQQSRDMPRPLNGTATIAGVVTTDETTPRPVRRAIVTVVAAGDVGQRVTSTDDNGRFEMPGLPAGNVTVSIAKPGYVTTYYGSKRIGATTGVPVAVAEGQSVTVSVKLPHGAALTGVITDQLGQPVPQVPVRVQRVTISPTGIRSTAPMNVPGGPGGFTTDDRGVYRIYGLPPGDYLIVAQPRLVPGAFALQGGSTEVRPVTDAELKWADSHMAAPSSPSTSPGTAALRPPAQGAAVTYSNVFYPSTPDAGAATVVSVAAGQERAGMDIRLELVTTAHVEGSVAMPDGQPAPGTQVTMLQKTLSNDAGQLAVLASVGIAVGAGSGRSGGDGSFSIPGVEPGQYVLIARRGGPGPGAPTLWAMTDLSVAGQDVQGVALALAQGMTISGRATFEGQTPPPAAARVSIAVTALTGLGASSGSVITLPADGAFAVTGLMPATYRFFASMPGSAWTLKSAMVGDKDIADAPIDIKAGQDVSGVVLTFTDRAGTVSGKVYDAAGRPSADLSIVLFATDRSAWFTSSRRLKAPLRTASDGTFRFTGLLPGDYYLAALSDPPIDWSTAGFLDQIVPAAIKVTVSEGQIVTQDVRVGGGASAPR